jgi:TolA-binding protein
MASDNESMKKKIAENESTIEENKARVEELKKRINEQQGSLEILRGKFGELK